MFSKINAEPELQRALEEPKRDFLVSTRTYTWSELKNCIDFRGEVKEIFRRIPFTQKQKNLEGILFQKGDLGEDSEAAIFTMPT